MPPPNRPRQPTGHAAWEWITTDDGSRTLIDDRLNETYHSGCGAVAETLIVYLSHSGVLERLRQREECVVFEVGLGTATSFLLTAALAQFHRTPLVYHAVEWMLLPVELFGQLQLPSAIERCLSSGLGQAAHGADPHLGEPAFQAAEFQFLPQLVETWCDWVSQTMFSSDCLSYRCQLSAWVRLELYLGDARAGDAAWRKHLPRGGCDAIYFDPFSPETNPDLWSRPIFTELFGFLKPGGRLTSYCVKSSVRRELALCGFEIHKVPGPRGGKREVLLAIKPSINPTVSSQKQPHSARR